MAVDYSMRISRLTVDKLGVKLYDKVSAVIAELIANAYDADAANVTVRAPMGQFLATRAGGDLSDKGFEIEVLDDGIGMTPQQVQKFFLVVGAERRKDANRGGRSPHFKRKVMGRKGVGKLAPFGICKTIEVISAGGECVGGSHTDSGGTGYLTSHIILDYDRIVTLGDEPDERYKPAVGGRDGSYSSDRGTRIILKNFNRRKVPDIKVLSRQLAQRFGITSADWHVQVMDNTRTDLPPRTIDEFDIETMPGTRLTFKQDRTVLGPDDKPEKGLTAGFDHEGAFHAVTGWMAYSKTRYKDDLMAGVRIYCRGKIASQTSVFNQGAGFTGEYNIRSYLVGEVHADWLDEDEDLIQTDRRDILWSDELAVSFQEWGQCVVKRIGTLSRNPLRLATLELFLDVGEVDSRIQSAYPTEEQQAIRDRAKEIAQIFGRSLSRGEVEDASVVKELVDLSISIAPHVTLNSMMKEAVASADTTISVLGSFLRTARLAELSSFGRIADDRLKVIKLLETLKDGDDTEEKDLQQLITDAPWLINPEWAPVTQNQAFSSLRREFEKYYESKTGESISLSDFRNPLKRPDFVFSNQERKVQIIEIKKPGHRLTDVEMDRISKYCKNMKTFLEDPVHEKFRQHFADFHITVVCDSLGLGDTQEAAFEGFRFQGKLTHMDWAAFLLKSEQVHQDFLEEARRQRTTGPASPDEG